MSGGHYDYAFSKLNTFIDDLEIDNCNEDQKEVRLAFKMHLEKVSDAIKAIEWVDSGDCTPGDEIQDIENVYDDIINSKDKFIVGMLCIHDIMKEIYGERCSDNEAGSTNYAAWAIYDCMGKLIHSSRFDGNADDKSG